MENSFPLRQSSDHMQNLATFLPNAIKRNQTKAKVAR